MLALRAFALRISLCCFAFAALAQTRPQNVAENFTAPSLKIRPRNALRIFPDKGDVVLLQASGHIPLGAESVRLVRGAHSKDAQSATIMASLEAPELGHITVFEHDRHHYVVNERGEPILYLPPRLTFRVTASSLVDIADQPFEIDSSRPLSDFLRTLSFSAHIFRAGTMEREIISPTIVRNIGIPLDIAAEERVFRASFDVGALSVEDHVVLEVNSADGALVGKFFVQLK